MVGDRPRQVGGDHPQEDGDNLNHPPAPDVAHHHHGDGHQGDGPVGAAGVDGRLGQGQA